MAANDTSIDARDWSLLGLLSVLWGGSFFFNGVVLRELPPLTVVFLRVTLAALMLLPLLRLYKVRFPDSLSGWAPFIAIGLLNNVLPFSLVVMGQTYIPSGLASILNATTPLFTVVVMAVAGEEKLHVRRIAGVVAGLIGVIILQGGAFGWESGQGLGILLCLAAAFSYGLSALLARRCLSNSPPLGTATFQLLASAAMMTVVAGLVERPWQLPMPGAVTWFSRDRSRRAVHCACLHRVLSDFAAFRRDQRHAGDVADPGDGNLARSTGAGRENLGARDRGRARDRQRVARHRRARVEAVSAVTELPFVAMTLRVVPANAGTHTALCYRLKQDG